jgi:hypothetical protein
MKEFGVAERRSDKGSKRDCIRGVAERSPDLVQPGFTTGGKWIHESKRLLSASGCPRLKLT